MMSKNLKMETLEPGIQIIKISRPQALNALNTETLRELDDVLKKVASDEAVRVVVLTGDGEKAFIAGADIAEMKDKSPAEGVEFAQLGHSVARSLERMKKPTIAAVNGYALGGGTEMAIACDLIIATDNAVFGQPEVGLGITPGFGATFRLAKFVGIPRAKELIFSGRRVKADEALKIGLANHVYPAAEFWAKAVELAKSMAMQSQLAVSKSKELINDLCDSGVNAKIDAEAHAFGGIFGSHDQREGMTAFVEKRKPKLKGLS